MVIDLITQVRPCIDSGKLVLAKMDSHKSAKQDIDISWDDYMDIKVEEHPILVEPKQKSYEPGNYYTDINLEEHQMNQGMTI